MLYKQLGLVELISAITKKVEEKTGIRCYDARPQNVPSPFYFTQVVKKRNADSKTMLRDVFTVWIHIISPSGESYDQIYQMITKLEQALSEYIQLPQEFKLDAQTNSGVQTIKIDENNEQHAVMVYEFIVSYGIKCKN